MKNRVISTLSGNNNNNNNLLYNQPIQQHKIPKNSFVTMNYSDCELSDDDTQPHPQQGQQNVDQSPSSSTQTTPLGSKGHNTRKCGVQPNRKQKKTSNEPNKKDTKGKRGGSNCSQQQAVNPSHSPSSSSSSSPTTPKKPKEEEKRVQGQFTIT